jgi:hypothetical protein
MSTSPLFLLLLTALLTFTAHCKIASTQASLHDNSQNCTCYTLDSDISPAYFLYHKFYDFRSLPATPAPPLINANQRNGGEQTQDQNTLNSSSWNNDWEIQSWGKKSNPDAPVAMQNSAQNVYIGNPALHPQIRLPAITSLLPYSERQCL